MPYSLLNDSKPKSTASQQSPLPVQQPKKSNPVNKGPSTLPWVRRIPLYLFNFKLYVFPVLFGLALYLLATGQVSKLDMILFVVMFLIPHFGISAGYHRMETHRSFKPHPLVRFLLLAAGSMGGQGPVTLWVSAHWKHHASSDRAGDPHSPRVGFLYSHVLWIKDFPWLSNHKIYQRAFANDKMLLFFEDTVLLWTVVAVAVPLAIGGWSGLLWGYVVANFLSNHLTWAVNSVGHMFGSRTYPTPDESRNNFILALLTCGEGWHNNHHAFPRSAYHGLKWFQVDFTGYLVSALKFLRLVKDVHRVKP